MEIRKEGLETIFDLSKPDKKITVINGVEIIEGQKPADKPKYEGGK